MNDLPKWGNTIALIASTAIITLTVISGTDELLMAGVSYLLVFTYAFDMKSRLFPIARYAAAAGLLAGSAVAFVRVEAPFPLFFELWGDMSDTDFRNMLTAIGLGSLSVTLVTYAPPRKRSAVVE